MGVDTSHKDTSENPTLAATLLDLEHCIFLSNFIGSHDLDTSKPKLLYSDY